MPKFLFFVGFILLVLTGCIRSEKNNVQKDESSKGDQFPLALQSDQMEFPPALPSSQNSRLLNAHWNLVSFPVENVTDLSSLLSSQSWDGIESVWSWDASLGSHGDWRVFPKKEEYELLSNVVPDAGYWIQNRKEVNFSGTGVSGNLYSFAQGWNLIGYSHSATPVTVARFLEDGDFWQNSCGSGEAVHSMWAWSDVGWQIYFPGDTATSHPRLDQFNQNYSSQFSFLDEMEPGMGLWVNANRDNNPPAAGDCPTPAASIVFSKSSVRVKEGATGMVAIKLSKAPTADVQVALSTSDSTLGTVAVTELTFSTDNWNWEQTIVVEATDNSTEDGNQDFLLKFSVSSSDTDYDNLTVPDFPVTRLDDEILDDHGETAASATVLTVGEQGTGILGENDPEDYDFFSFVPTAGGHYQIVVESDELEQYSYDLCWGNCPDNSINFAKTGVEVVTADSSDSIVFSVHSYEESVGSYTVQVNEYDDDHGNTSSSVTTIDLETSVSGNLEVVGDIDYFAFVPTAGNSYQIEVMRDSLEGHFRFDCYKPNSCGGFIFNEDGESYGVVSARNSEAIVFTVFTELFGGLGTYSVKVKSFVDDHGNSELDSSPLTEATPISGSLEVLGDADYFAFTPQSEGNFQIQVTTDGMVEFLPAGCVFCPSSTESGNIFYSTFEASADNPAFFNVYSDGNGLGSYTVEVNRYTDDHSGDRENAKMLVEEQSASGALEVVGDLDLFKIIPVPGESYQVFVSRGDLDGSFQAGCFVCSLNVVEDSEATGQFAFESETTDPIYFYVKSTGTTGSYTLQYHTFSDDHGGVEGSGTPLTVGQSLSGNLEVQGDTDYFLFTPTVGKSYHVKLTPGTLEGSYSFQHCRRIGCFYNFPSPLTNRYTFLAKTDELWGFKVSSATQTGTYAIEAFEFVDDHGNDAGSASLVELGTETAGNLEFPGDSDYFHLVPAIGMSYQVKASRGTLDSNFSLECVDSTLCNVSYISADGLEGSIVFTATSTDAIAFHISSSRGSGTYTVEVNSFEDDHGNSKWTATELTMGESMLGSLTESGDSDYFSFVPTAGAAYRIQVTRDSLNGSISVSCTSYMYCDDFRVDEDEMEDSGVVLNSSIDPITFFTFSSGGKLGSYSVQVTPFEDDHGNRSTEATQMLLGESQSGAIEISGDKDYFSFVPEVGTSYQVSATIENSNLFRLYCGDYSCPSVRVSTYTPMGAISMESLSTDPITFFMESNETGGYTLDLKAYDDDHSNLESQATAIDVNGIHSGVIEVSGDQDHFQFTADAGKTYQIQAFRGTLSNRFSLECSLPCSSTATETASSTLVVIDSSSAGTMKFSIHGQGSGSYSVQVSEYADDHASTVQEATLLTLSQPVNGVIGRSSESDVFSFEATANTDYILQITDTDIYPRIYCDHSDCPWNFFGSGGRPFTVDSDQTVIFKLGSYGGGGAYTIVVVPATDDHGSSGAEATSIVLDQQVSGNFEKSWEYDYFSIDLAPNTSYVLLSEKTFSGQMFAGGSHAGGMVLSGETSFSGPTFGVDSAQSIGFAVGSPHVGQYSVQVNSYVDDHRNTALGGSSIVLNQSMPGTFEVAEDQDFFSVSTSASTSYQATVTQGGTSGDFILSIAAEEKRVNASESRASLAFGPASSGVQSIQIVGASTSSYSVEVNHYEDDHSNMSGEATALALLQSGSGNLEVAGDLDFFHFSATVGNNYVIETGKDSLDNEIEICRMSKFISGEPVISEFVSCTENRGEFTAEATKEVFWVKSDGTGSYTVLVKSDG